MQEEYLDVIDERDNILETLSYDIVHKAKKRHRIVHLLIKNNKGELLLQKRSANKISYPLHWSMSVGGHVQSKETYRKAAIREAEEELGFTPKKFTEIKKEQYIDAQGHSIIFTAFIITYDGPFVLCKDEVAEVKFFSKKEIQEKMITKAHMHPELLFLLERVSL